MKPFKYKKILIVDSYLKDNSTLMVILKFDSFKPILKAIKKQYKMEYIGNQKAVFYIHILLNQKIKQKKIIKQFIKHQILPL